MRSRSRSRGRGRGRGRGRSRDDTKKWEQRKVKGRGGGAGRVVYWKSMPESSPPRIPFLTTPIANETCEGDEK